MYSSTHNETKHSHRKVPVIFWVGAMLLSGADHVRGGRSISVRLLRSNHQGFERNGQHAINVADRNGSHHPLIRSQGLTGFE